MDLHACVAEGVFRLASFGTASLYAACVIGALVSLAVLLFQCRDVAVGIAGPEPLPGGVHPPLWS